jgi:gliding motility-associated-like protein
VLAPPAVSIGGSAVLCNGSASNLTATAGLSSYVWSTNENGPSLSVNAAGTYTVTATDVNGCTNTASSTVFRSETIEATAVTTAAGCQTDGAIIVEEIRGGAIPYWVSVGNARRQNDGLADVIFENLPKGTYLLTVTDANGCTTNQSLAIEQRCTSEIYAPNAIAPERGDNAYFMLFGSGDFNIDRLQIFDRWGNKMSELLDIPGNEPTAGWDGRFNNKWVLPGVYVYWAKITWPDGQTSQISGEVTVVR